jgi:hypothetical protein
VGGGIGVVAEVLYLATDAKVHPYDSVLYFLALAFFEGGLLLAAIDAVGLMKRASYALYAICAASYVMLRVLTRIVGMEGATALSLLVAKNAAPFIQTTFFVVAAFFLDLLLLLFLVWCVLFVARLFMNIFGM